MYTYIHVYVYKYTYVYIYICISGYIYGSTRIGLVPALYASNICLHAYALPSGARHARSEATRVVTTNCTSHRIKTAHNRPTTAHNTD